MTTVTNASPLIVLAKINQFSLLPQLFTEIIIPDAVWQEIVIHGAGRPATNAVIQAERQGWLQRRVAQDKLAVSILQTRLGAGESEAIVLAQQCQATWVLLDDDLARTQAHRLQLAVKGTVGILLAGYYAGIVKDLKKSLDELRAHNFRLSDTIYQSVLAHVKPL